METRCCATEGCYKDAVAPSRFCRFHAEEFKTRQIRTFSATLAETYVDEAAVESAAPIIERAYHERSARVPPLEWREQSGHGRYLGHSIYDDENRAVVESMRSGVRFGIVFASLLTLFFLSCWVLWNLGATVLSWQMPKGFFLTLGVCVGFLTASILDLVLFHRFSRDIIRSKRAGLPYGIEADNHADD